MKTKILLSAMILCSAIAAAQDDDYNPYAKFGSKPIINDVKKEALPPKVFELQNSDTTVEIAILRFNVTERIISFLDRDRTVLDSLHYVIDDMGFISTDPHYYNSPNSSPYAYCSNDPINRVDPTGMTDYEITEPGHINRIGDINKDPDKLFNSDRTQSITVSDKSILSSLSQSGKSETTNSTDAFNVFKFAADNSSPEWSLKGYNSGDKMGFLLGTSYDAGSVGIGNGNYAPKTMAFSLHSHPDGLDNIGPSGYVQKLPNGSFISDGGFYEGSDCNTLIFNVKNKIKAKHYIYHEGTKKIIYYDIYTAADKITQNERGVSKGVVTSGSQIRKIILGN